MKPITRRTLFAATAGTAACSNPPSTAEKPQVQILKAPSYGQELFETVRRIFSHAKLDLRGKRVILKPNLVEFDPRTAINTHPMVVHAVLEAARASGATDIRIAEAPGHRRISWDVAEAAGYFSEIPGFTKLFTDLNTADFREVNIPSPHSGLKSLHLPTSVLGADLLISIPKLKTHHWVGATLSLKNMFGIVPGAIYGWPKNVLHWAGIDESIADIHKLLPPHFCIVDGVTGMEGNGPIQGTPKQAGVLIAGHDMPAVDATCARIMHLNPAMIRYLQLAATNGQLEEGAIIQTGETIASVATPFALLPRFEPFRLRP